MVGDPSRGEKDESCETAMDMDLGKHGKIVGNRWSQKMCDIQLLLCHDLSLVHIQRAEQV